MHYTAESIQTMLCTRLLEERHGWLNKLHENRPDKWWCDQRTEDLFVLTQWLIFIIPEGEDRQRILWFFNRKTRASQDVFEIAAQAINQFYDGKIDNYQGR